MTIDPVDYTKKTDAFYFDDKGKAGQRHEETREVFSTFVKKDGNENLYSEVIVFGIDHGDYWEDHSGNKYYFDDEGYVQHSDIISRRIELPLAFEVPEPEGDPNNVYDLSPFLPIENEYWIRGNHCSRLLTYLVGPLQFYFKTTLSNPYLQREGNDNKLYILDMSNTTCQGHIGAHKKYDFDLGFFTFGPTNMTSWLYDLYTPFTENDYTPVWSDNKSEFLADNFDFEKNFTLWSGLPRIFPETEFILNTKIIEELQDWVQSEFGYDAWKDVSHRFHYDGNSHKEHIHIRLGNDVNWSAL